MNILLIAPKYFPIFNKDDRGAIEKLEQFYLRHNEIVGNTFTVYSPKTKNDHDHPNTKCSYFRNVNQTSVTYKLRSYIYALKRRIVGSSNNECYIRTIAKDIIKRNEQDHYDLIIFENGEQNIPVFKKLTKTSTKIILHLHTDYVNVERKQSRDIIKSCDEIWVVSDFLSRRVNAVEKINTIIIPNAIDFKKNKIDKEKIALLKKQYNSDSNKIFLYVGRLLKSKGVPQLIEAFDKYNQKNKDSKLLIIGDTDGGKEGRDIKKIINIAVAKNKNIQYLGFIKPDNLPNYQAIADCQIIPSIWEEAFGLVVLEAMAAGLKIIASKSGGIPEIGRNTITYVDRDDIVNQLVGAMENITKGKKDYSHILKEYSKEKYLSLIEHNIAKSRTPKGKQVLIANQSHTNNYGDIAIGKSIAENFASRGFKVIQKPYCDEPSTYGRLWNLKIFRKLISKPLVIKDYFNRKRIQSILDKQNYKAVIIGGGELASSHREFNSCFYVWAEETRKRNIPLYVLGVSGDSEMNQKMLARYQEAMKYCRKIMVRDNTTKKIMQNYYNRNPKVFPDVVFARKVSKTKKKKDNLLITLINPSPKVYHGLHVSSKQEYFDYYFNLLNKEPCNNIIVAPSVKNDEGISLEFFNYLKTKKKLSKTIQYVGYSTLNNFESLLDGTKTIISARMHVMILGLLYGCNIKPIPFKTKLITFEKEYSNITPAELKTIQRLSCLQFDIISTDIKDNLN